MKIIVTCLAFLAGVCSAFAQNSVEKKGGLVAMLLQPMHMEKIWAYKLPTLVTKGKIMFRFNRSDDFFSYDSNYIVNKIRPLTGLIRYFILKDSALHFDNPMIYLLDKAGRNKMSWAAQLTSEYISSTQLERINCFIDVMPVFSFLNFSDPKNNKQDVKLFILGDDWEIRNDLTAMDNYADVACLIIYDFILEKNDKKYGSITIKTLTRNGMTIHEKTYDLKKNQLFKFYTSTF